MNQNVLDGVFGQNFGVTVNPIVPSQVITHIQVGRNPSLFR